MSEFRDLLRRQQAHAREAARLRNVLKSRFGFEPENVQRTMLEILTKRLPPRLPSRPPLVNGRPALKGEIF